jgi:hypothetical protein
VWNADVVPASRGWWLAPVAAVVVAGLAAAGWRPLVRRLGRAASRWLAACAGAGLLLAVASGWSVTRPTVGTLVSSVPGLGLVRDAQKWLLPLALLLAVAGALGVGRLLARVPDRGARGALAALALVLPVLVLPDLAWGAAGRLRPVEYPADWSVVRQTLQAQPGTGDVAVLPWSAFRAFAWNDRRTLLDPAPRWLPVTAVVDDSLVVRRGDELVTVSGEDPRASAIAAALAQGRPLASVLPGLGVGWVLLEDGQPPDVPASAMVGLDRVFDGGDLTLWRVPGDVAILPAPAYASAVVVVDVLVVGVLGALGVLAALRLLRRRPDRDPPVLATAGVSPGGAARLRDDPD